MIRTSKWVVAFIAIMGLSLSVSAQTFPGEPDNSTRAVGVTSKIAGRQAKPAEDSARALLLKRVKSVDWDETAFEEIIEWLNGLGGEQVNVVPRWRPLSEEGVNRDSFITLRLRDVTVSEVLDETVDQLSDAGKVTYQAAGNTLRISTRADFDRKLFVRTYDVPDIIFIIPDFTQSAPIIDLEAASRSGGGGGGGGGQSVFSGMSSSTDEFEDNEQEREERMEELIELITTVIAPDSWAETGGGRGQIKMWSSALVVYNTAEVHEQIAGFFAMNQ